MDYQQIKYIKKSNTTGLINKKQLCIIIFKGLLIKI